MPSYNRTHTPKCTGKYKIFKVDMNQFLSFSPGNRFHFYSPNTKKLDFFILLPSFYLYLPESNAGCIINDPFLLNFIQIKAKLPKMIVKRMSRMYRIDRIVQLVDLNQADYVSINLDRKLEVSRVESTIAGLFNSSTLRVKYHQDLLPLRNGYLMLPC